MNEVGLKTQIKLCCKQIILNQINLIEGCRKISTCCTKLNEYNKAFNFFRGIDSETDIFPFGNLRKKFNKIKLKELDRERIEYEKKIYNDVIKYCEIILESD